MKKTFFVMALLVGATITSLQATEGAKEIETASLYGVKTNPVKKINSFCMAIVKGDLDTVKKMIQFGESVNKTSNGKTPLMYAARYNRVEIIQLLLKNGAEVETKDKLGHKAVDYAKISKAFAAEEILEKVAK